MRDLTPEEAEEARQGCLTHEQYARLKFGGLAAPAGQIDHAWREETSMTEFEKRVQEAINYTSRENGSNTPDWILASYLRGCLEVFNKTVKEREKYYGRAPVPVPLDQCPKEAQ